MNSANEALKQFNDDVYEIDLKALFIKIKALWYYVVVCALAGGILGLSYFTFLTTPHYQSSSMVYLRSSDKKISLESLQLSSNLTKDYEIAIHDPHIDNPNFVSFKDAVSDADLILILCDHNEFKNLDYTLIHEDTIIFDTKNIIYKVPDNIKLYNYGNLYELNDS